MRADQIVFSSLLLGLMVGLQTVSVEIPANLSTVRTVEYLLDGRRAAAATKDTQWQGDVDFGPLSPHELTAVARDRSGREVGKVTRFVNLPEPPARLELVIDRNGFAQPVGVRLVATSMVRDAPLRRELRLDGVSIEVDGEGHAALPPLDMTLPHVLSGAAAFSNDVIAHADVAIGGGIQDESGSRLTAVPVRLKQRLLPSAESLAGMFARRGASLKVVTVERGRATVVFVRHPDSLEASQRLSGTMPLRGDPLKLESTDRIGFVWPLTMTLPGAPEKATLFEATALFPGSSGGFHWFLTRVSRPGTSSPPYRYADAVAIAGMESYAEGSRRAVILVEGGDRNDVSELTPAQVKEYLKRIGTPLHVWTVVRSVPSIWTSHSEDVASTLGLQSAMNRLRQDLGSQAVVWLAGEWSPTEIELASTVKSMEMLSREAPSK